MLIAVAAGTHDLAMKLPSFRSWIVALVVCAIVVVACVWFVDLPVAVFMHAHVGSSRKLSLALNLVLLVIPFSGLWLLACGCARLAGYVLPPFAVAPTAASFSVMWATACNYFLLQPGFGRIAFSGWMAAHQYGFDWLHGHNGRGFPSGHTTLAASFLFALWLRYPRARWLIATLMAAEGVGVVVLNWHFVSDAIGGNFVGATTALMATAMLRNPSVRPDCLADWDGEH